MQEVLGRVTSLTRRCSTVLTSAKFRSQIGPFFLQVFCRCGTAVVCDTSLVCFEWLKGENATLVRQSPKVESKIKRGLKESDPRMTVPLASRHRLSTNYI
jgi:hypothetical protein